MKRLIITIDGPAGAGKSTVAREVARRLGYAYIDTGAMYRAVAFLARREGVDPSDHEKLTAIAKGLHLRFHTQDGNVRVFVGEEDVTAHLRTPEIDQIVAHVAMVPGVRKALVEQQRRLAEGGGVVLEGRDTGTYVVPFADLKFYLTADLETRLERRYRQLRGKGHQVSRNDVRRELEERDRLDTRRGDSPLQPARGAIVVDTTKMSTEETITAILTRCQEEGGSPDL